MILIRASLVAMIKGQYHEKHQHYQGGGGGENFANRTLFHGDNLPFLRALNSECVDLIATDPPFNKGKDFHATPDSLAQGASFQDRWSWKKDVQEAWCDNIKDDKPRLMEAIESARYAHSDGMGAFMCFLSVRLLEMHRILKPTGSIYLHCDTTASHYIKACMDAIFGAKNFRNEIAWCYRGMPSKARSFMRKKDYILFYTKSNAHTWNTPRGEPTEGSVRTFERAKRVGYNVNLSKKMATVFDWRKYNQAVKEGILPADLQPKEFTGGHPPLNDWWADITILAPTSKERVGYPTQKPLELYRRIIKASSNKGDVVLDPFCGCATTLIAAESTGRKWVGIDLWKKAAKVVKDRLLKEDLAVKGGEPQKMQSRFLAIDEIDFINTPPERTDLNRKAVVPFKTQVKFSLQEPAGRQQTHKEMKAELLARHGSQCQGCDTIFNDPRHLEIDHNTPRSDGGINHISNRVLLCPPCNRIKSNKLTLSGLRARNKKEGWMAAQAAEAARSLIR